jgi:chromosome segregation ATPase
MAKQATTIETMQADHRTWLAAYAQWRQEIERWQAEHGAAVARLAKLQQIVREHGECLEEHARAFQTVEDAIADHERELSKHQAKSGQQPDDVVMQHQEQEDVFSRQRDAHERIQKHHQAVMAQLQALESSASAAM